MRKILPLSLALFSLVPMSAGTKNTTFADHSATVEVTPEIGTVAIDDDQPVTEIMNTSYSRKKIQRASATGADTTYSRPKGSFYASCFVNSAGQISSYGQISAPAFTQNTWKKVAPEEGKDYLWKYYWYDDSLIAYVTTEKSNEISFAYKNASGEAVTYAPTLFFEGKEDGPSFRHSCTVRYGGRNLVYDAANHPIYQGSANFTTRLGFCRTSSTYGITGKTNVAGAYRPDSSWTKFVRANEIADSAHLVTIGEFFEKPESPYTLSGLRMLVALQATPNAKIGMTAYPADEDGNVDFEHPLATGSGVFTADLSDKVYGKEITFTTTDCESGLQMPTLVDSRIFVTIDNVYENDSFINFRPYMAGLYADYADALGEKTSCAVLDLYATPGSTESKRGLIYTRDYGNYTVNGNTFCLPSAFISIDASFDFMRCDSTYFEAPVEGGNKMFVVTSSNSGDDFFLDGVDGEDAPEWVQYDYTDNVNAKGNFNNTTNVTFKVDPLPAGVTGRVAKVALCLTGAQKVFTINQGTTGITGTEADTATTVSVENGNFVVTALPSVKNVTVYNTAGQMMKTAAIDGKTVINAQDLTQGVYILRFDNGRSLKVIK